VIVMDTVKKSKASHVHPRKPAANISHWWDVSSRKIATGFLNLFYPILLKQIPNLPR
jgi:hypothetical protein